MNHIELMNATRGEVEEMLLAGRAPAEVVRELQEPMVGVLAVYRELRDEGRLTAANHAPPVTPSLTQQIAHQSVSAVPKTEQPERPTHTPDADLSARIAGATDLLVRAADIDDRRVQNALGRARKAMVDLAGLVETWEGKSVARKRIERLEAELRIARAELRGEPGTGADKVRREMSPARLAALEKMRASQHPVDCPDCGKTCMNPAGLSAHQRGGKCGVAA